MRLAVIQHDMRGTPEEDVEALSAAVRAAAEAGADLTIVPCVCSLDTRTARDALASEVAPIPGCTLVLSAEGTVEGGIAIIRGPQLAAVGLGAVATIAGDACFRRDSWDLALLAGVDAVFLSPCSENDIQAEAALEVALALSDSLAGLVAVAECVGAETGDPGHGGSVVVFLGEVVAESCGGRDLLIADLPVPVVQPEPREPLPEVPALISQRLAFHATHAVAVENEGTPRG